MSGVEVRPLSRLPWGAIGRTRDGVGRCAPRSRASEPARSGAPGRLALARPSAPHDLCQLGARAALTPPLLAHTHPQVRSLWCSRSPCPDTPCGASDRVATDMRSKGGVDCCAARSVRPTHQTAGEGDVRPHPVRPTHTRRLSCRPPSAASPPAVCHGRRDNERRTTVCETTRVPSFAARLAQRDSQPTSGCASRRSAPPIAPCHARRD